MIRWFKEWRVRRKKFRGYDQRPDMLADLKFSSPHTSQGICVWCGEPGGHKKDCIWKYAQTI